VNKNDENEISLEENPNHRNRKSDESRQKVDGMDDVDVRRGEYQKEKKTPSNKNTGPKKQTSEPEKRKTSPVKYKKKLKTSEEYHQARVKDKRKSGNKKSNSAKVKKQGKIQWEKFNIDKDREKRKAEKDRQEGTYSHHTNTGKKVYNVEKPSWNCSVCGTSNWGNRTECRNCTSLTEDGEDWECENCGRVHRSYVKECRYCDSDDSSEERDTRVDRDPEVRHTSQDQAYLSDIIVDDDSEEDAPVTGPALLENPQIGFKYHETKKFLFLEWRVEKRGWMFTDLVPTLLKLRGRPNSVTLTGYLLTAAADSKVIQYKTAYLESNLTTEDFDQQISNFFFYEMASHTEQLKSLALANSKYIDHIRSTSKFMNVLRLMTGSDSWEWFVKVLKVIGIVTLVYKLIKWYLNKKQLASLAINNVVAPMIRKGLKINKVNSVEDMPELVDPLEVLNKTVQWTFTVCQPPAFSVGYSMFPVVVRPWWGKGNPTLLIENPFHGKPTPSQEKLLALTKYLSQVAMQDMSQLSTWKALKIALLYWKNTFLSPIWQVIRQRIVRWIRPTNHNYHAIFPQFPRFSAVLEEVIKIIPGAWRLIAVIERWQNGDWRTYKWHKRSSAWSFGVRLKEHWKINSQEPGELSQSYDQFVKTGVFSCPSGMENNVKTVDRMILPIPKINEPKPYATLSHPQMCVPCPNPGKVYIGLWFVSRFVGIANSFENNECAIQHRILDIPNSKIDKSSLAYSGYLEVYSNIKVDREELPNWHKTLNARQKKNILDAEDNDKKQVSFKHLKCQIKSDEMLNAKEKMVPRFLTNQAGQEFLRMGRATAEINHWLANSYWTPYMDHPITLKGYTVTACFAHGTTSDKLNTYINRAMEVKGIHGMFLGDDTGAVVCVKQPEVIENDFSGFDRSECDDLRAVDDMCLERCGFTELVKDKKIMYAKKLYIPSNKKWGRKLSPIKDRSGEKVEMRMTGESDTCGGNTRINYASTVSGILANLDADTGEVDLEALRQHYSDLGLTAKLKKVKPNRLTFLKGVFLRGVDEKLYWVRLPSFLFKFGKVLTDPNVNDKRPLSYNAKIRACVLGQWKGYGDMCSNWFYTAIDKEVRRICGDVQEFVSPLEDWQVFQTHTWIPDPEWNQFCYDRYKLQPEDMREIIYSFQLIEPEDLPCLHRVQCLDLLDVDY
jgi:hypothetical protein